MPRSRGSKPSTPHHTGLGSRAERKCLVQLHNNSPTSPHIDWEQLKVQRNARDISVERTVIGSTGQGPCDAAPGQATNNKQKLALIAQRGVARMENDCALLNTKAHSVFREQESAFGNNGQMKRFSPKQISQKRLHDEMYQLARAYIPFALSAVHWLQYYIY